MQVNSISTIDRDAVKHFCARWKIRELDLFGSILRDDFGPDSDVDFLVTFEDAAHWTLLDMVQMEDELASIVGRAVELVSKSAIEQSPNWRRKERILNSAQPFQSLSQESACLTPGESGNIGRNDTASSPLSPGVKVNPLGSYEHLNL